MCINAREGKRGNGAQQDQVLWHLEFGACRGPHLKVALMQSLPTTYQSVGTIQATRPERCSSPASLALLPRISQWGWPKADTFETR